MGVATVVVGCWGALVGAVVDDDDAYIWDQINFKAKCVGCKIFKSGQRRDYSFLHFTLKAH